MNAQELAAQVDGLVQNYLLPLGWRIGSAVAVWIVGGWIVRIVLETLRKRLVTRQVEPTLARYVAGTAAVVLKILLIIAVLGVLGIETTSFAALLAAAGIAIGAAWVEILEVSDGGRVLAVGPHCHTDHYWQVYFDANRVVDEFCAAAR